MLSLRIIFIPLSAEQMAMKIVLVSVFLFVCACAAQDPEKDDMEKDFCDLDGTCTDDNKGVVQMLEDTWGRIEFSLNFGQAPLRRRRSAGYDYGYNNLQYNVPYGYGPGYFGGYRGYEHGSYRAPVKQEHRSFHYTVPGPSYHKSFREGKWHLDNKHVVKNYYKKGTYEVAKKYFIALNFVKIIPVKTTTSVDYIGELRSYSGYKVRLCEHCYNGQPQIEVNSLQSPYRNVIRRFNFLPGTKRTRTEYGHAKIVQVGGAKVSHDQGKAYHGEYLNKYPGNGPF